MALPIPNAGGPANLPPVPRAVEGFAQVLGKPSAVKPPPCMPSAPVQGQAPFTPAPTVVGKDMARAADSVLQAQKRLDSILSLALSGRTFTPAELLGLQARVYRASQELDLAGKVVEKASAGVKHILQTQL
jgi:hypothetical protein